MKKVIYNMDQMKQLVMALNTLKIQGMDQANAMVLCQQIIDNPIDVIDEPDKEIKEGEQK